MKYKFCGIYEEKEKKEEQTNIYLRLVYNTCGEDVDLDVVDENGDKISGILFLDKDGINRCTGIEAGIAKALGLPLDDNGCIRIHPAVY